MGIVEVDGGLQHPLCHGHADTSGEVLLHIAPEVEEQYQKLAIGRRERKARRVQVDAGRARVLKGLHGFLERVQHWLRLRHNRKTSQSLAGYAETSALPPVRVHSLGAVGR